MLRTTSWLVCFESVTRIQGGWRRFKRIKGKKESEVFFIQPVFFEFNRRRDFLTTTEYYFHWRGGLLESPLAPRRVVSLSRFFSPLHPKTWSWLSQIPNLLNGWFRQQRQNCGHLKRMYRDGAGEYGEDTLLMCLVRNNEQKHFSSFQNQAFKLHFAIARRVSLRVVTDGKNLLLNPRITFTSAVLKNLLAWRYILPYCFSERTELKGNGTFESLFVTLPNYLLHISSS